MERIQVKGMHCGHCVARVRAAVEEVEGARVGQVEIGEVQLEGSPDPETRRKLEAAIRDAGYEPA